MQRTDFLLRHIEFFFNLLKKIVGISFENIKIEELEQIYDGFLKQNLGININDIDKLDIEKYKDLLFNETNRNLVILLFLKIAKIYETKDFQLGKKYFLMAQKIKNHSYLSTKFQKDLIDIEIENLSNELKNYE